MMMKLLNTFGFMLLNTTRGKFKMFNQSLIKELVLLDYLFSQKPNRWVGINEIKAHFDSEGFSYDIRTIQRTIKDLWKVTPCIQRLDTSPTGYRIDFDHELARMIPMLTKPRLPTVFANQRGQEIKPERPDVLASGAIKTLLPNGETKWLLQDYMGVTVGDTLSVGKVLGFERWNHYMMWVYVLTDSGEVQRAYAKEIAEIAEKLRKVRNSIKED